MKTTNKEEMLKATREVKTYYELEEKRKIYMIANFLSGKKKNQIKMEENISEDEKKNQPRVIYLLKLSFKRWVKYFV